MGYNREAYEKILEEKKLSRKEHDMIEIDLLKLVLILWKKVWAIVLAAVAVGIISFAFTYNFIEPLYQSSIKVYVNNSQKNDTASITTADISASKALVDTYIVTLKTRTTLNQIINVADLDYTYEELNEMISATAVNGTEVFQVTVTAEDPKEAALIANTVAEVLPKRIMDIVENSSVRIVDYAIKNDEPVSPSYVKNVVIGAMVGAVISIAFIFLQYALDNKIHSEEYLIENYKYPILAVIPDLNTTSKQKYYRRKKSGYSQNAGAQGTASSETAAKEE